MHDLIRAAECVLFDFDGPICDLFRNHPAPEIAERMRGLIRERGAQHLLTEKVWEAEDPQAFLHRLAPGSELAGSLERALTEEEVHAAKTAAPAPYADPLIRTLVATGRRVAVTTNNSQESVERYLETRDLIHHFAGHIHGRTRNLRLLKPHPDCLLRALASTATGPGRALMIGDTVNDMLAAKAAGVPFLGYSPRPHRREELRGAGANHTAATLEDVLNLVLTLQND